jgi:hypothetical protein
MATWNPSDSGGGSFSNGNLTIAGTGTAFVTTRATAPVAAGSKVYVEATIDRNGTAFGSNGDWALGVATTAQATNTFIGPNGSAAFGYFPWTGLIFANGAVGTLQIGAVGSTVCLAFDLTAFTFQIRINGGAWSASQSFSNMSAGPFYLAFSVEGSDSQITANFGDSPFSFSVPAGYQSYNAATPIDPGRLVFAGFAPAIPNSGIVSVTQIGAEAWVSNNPALIATQVGAEAWVGNNPALIVSQIGVEVWGRINLASGPPAGALSYTGFVPGLPSFTNVAAGTLSITGFAPTPINRSGAQSLFFRGVF